MKRLLVTLMLLSSCAACANGRVGIGVLIGAPPPARVIAVPRQPGPDFVWVDGYWYPVDGRYVWHDGYWTRPPYAGAYWVVPRYTGGRFFPGYWDGRRGRVAHNHRWDRDRDRDGGRRR